MEANNRRTLMDKALAAAAADRIFADMAGAMTAGLCYVGTTTGLFRAMAGKGAMRADDVARASGLQPRYVTEWLHGMTATGYLDYDAAARTFSLSDERAYFLASDGTDHFVGGLFAMATVLMRVAPRVAQAFREGGGVPFEDYGADGVAALDMINRGQYEQRFTSYWMNALPDVVARLAAGGRALDVGCGAGRVSLALAAAWPDADIVGIDSDAGSIAQANDAARAAGARVRYLAQTTGELDRGAGFDLVTACDCVHDFAAPVATLAEIRALLKPEGALFIMEPKVADRLEDNRNAMAAMFYGFSVFHCMTQSLAQGGPGLGTCMGPALTEGLVRDAGFTRFERLAIKSQSYLFYAARP
jgi:2-polyprenyl-3-methyl-5-hydroxy-6-metoxy-1,4-benzoquinol methylase